MSTALVEKFQVPCTSAFSFQVPLPASASSSSSASSSATSPLKQRRVSLALPSAPRVVQAWTFRDDTGLDSHVPETEAAHQLMPEKGGKLRKIAVTDEMDADAAGGEKEKRQRKKWTAEETQMLVDGCNRHGVGNWKTILGDPNLKFDNRTPVDLKDRFRTYFPDAYRQHYPNARTHLSSRVRSTLPDGTSLFEKTRSKRRRPFTEEEDRALKAGYEKHGTVWATIVKDPVFRDQARRSTDLRDRFRNAFPELYQAAGYKPRAASAGVKTKTKKGFGKQARGLGMGVRAATDDQLAMSSTGVRMDVGGAGPVRSRRRAHTTGLLRGGTKSVPQSTACSEDEDSDSGVDELDPEEYLELPSTFKSSPTPVLVDNVSTVPTRRFGGLTVGANNVEVDKGLDDDPFPEIEMEVIRPGRLSSEPLGTIPAFLPNRNVNTSDLDTPSHTWSSGINTPTHSSNAWSTAAGSPTSSHLSTDYEYLMNTGAHSHSPSFSHASSNHDTRTNAAEGSSTIGKSAWGTQDWLLSANPRLDHTSSPSYLSPDASAHSHDLSLSPPALSLAFPFTHHGLTTNHSHVSSHLMSHTHGVLDRYDLLPASSSLSLSHHAHLHDFASDVGAGGGGDGFSDADAEFPPSGFRGFTHHSNYAGDLIFGARGSGSGFGGHGYYGHSLGSSAGPGAFGYGLGLSGIGGSGGGSMQLALPGIDEIEIAGITLEDHRQQGQEESGPKTNGDGDVLRKSSGGDSNASASTGDGGLSLDINADLGHNCDETHEQQPQMEKGPRRPTLVHSHSLSHLTANPQSSNPKFNLDPDDFVDFSRSQQDNGSELDLDLELNATPPSTPLLSSLSSFSATRMDTSSRPRSARRSSELTEYSHYHSYNHGNDGGSGQHHHGRSISVPPSEVRVRTSMGEGEGLPVGWGLRLGRGQEQRNASRNGGADSTGSDGTGRNHRNLPATAHPQPEQSPSVAFPSQMLLSTVSQDTWRTMAGTLPPVTGNINLSFLDLHYYSGGGGSGGHGDADMLNRDSGWEGSGRQGQALDLATPPSSLTSTTSLRALGIPASLRQHIPQLNAGARRKVMGMGVKNNGSFHQRGQSVVCPKDLVLRSGDNKRKRASWDGAHV